MSKRIYRSLCVVLCFLLVSGHTVFAQPIGDKFIIGDTYSNRSSSYTYVDLGTVTKKFSSDEVISSASALARIITLGAGIPTKTARFLADKLFKKITGYEKNTLYYTAEIHTTQVFLDGAFVYYIIDTETAIYSDSSRRKLVARETHSGQSLSPASLLPEVAVS